MWFHAPLLILGIVISGCALQESKPVSALEDGRLTKLNKKFKERQNDEEMTRLSRFIGGERSAVRQIRAKKFFLPEVVTEETLYSEILQAYNKRDLERLEYFSSELVKRYPKGALADNSVFLGAQLKLSLGLPGLALRDFELIISEYPMGNKRVAALLGKGIAYRKLQLYPFAERVLNDLRSEYPGSPEYFRAELEQKLIKVERESVK